MCTRLLPALALLLLANFRAAGADISQLRWLGGCWKSATAEPGSLEQWLPLAGDTLLGVSRTVKQGKTVEFEFMQIRAIAAGQLAFIAMPSGQSTATFPLLRLSETEAVFENLQHDFPQRVIYRIEAGTQLHARIEGMRNGSLRVVEFPMQRVSCDAQLAAVVKSMVAPPPGRAQNERATALPLFL